MHPPLFRKTHRLSDWPECVIELHCVHCRGGSVGYPVRLLIKREGDMTFENLRRLRCRRCQAVKPASSFDLVRLRLTQRRAETPLVSIYFFGSAPASVWGIAASQVMYSRVSASPQAEQRGSCFGKRLQLPLIKVAPSMPSLNSQRPTGAVAFGKKQRVCSPFALS